MLNSLLNLHRTDENYSKSLDPLCDYIDKPHNTDPFLSYPLPLLPKEKCKANST